MKPFLSTDGENRVRHASLVLLVLLCGLQAAHAQLGVPTTPNPPLPTVALKVGSARPAVLAEVARTPIQIQTGLMFRRRLSDNSGMFFVLDGEEKRYFWMANVPIPLSIAYLAADGEILEIHEMRAYDRNQTESRSDRVAFALEMNSGWFDLHGVRPGEFVKPQGQSFKKFIQQQRALSSDSFQP